MFPLDFDLSTYKKYKDLSSLSDKELYSHYYSYGNNEGRICCAVSDRTSLLKSIPSNVSCLEIGPFDAPVLIGDNVKYADVMDKEGLEIRARNIGRFGSVPFIHYVIPTFNIKDINEKFDVILSCHSIEHQVCLVRHLQNVSSLLNKNGYYIVICPDKRFCFDHFISETTIADVLEMYNANRSNHSLRSVLEHRSLTCHNDSVMHWKGDHGSPSIDVGSIKNALSEYQNTTGYIDVHSMQFTPASFSIVVSLLNELKLTDFVVERLYSTIFGSNEFFVVLKKSQ
jgi:hypothetical protein